MTSTSKIRLQNIVTCVLLGAHLLLSHLLLLKKPGVRLGDDLCRSPHSKELREASCQQFMRNWGLSPTTLKELNPANNYMSVSLKVDPAQLGPSDDCSL